MRIGSPPPAHPRVLPSASPRIGSARGGEGLGVGGAAVPHIPESPDHAVARARVLRRDMTDAERKLWWHLRRLPMEVSHFRRQASIGPYFADFASHRYRLVIEVD